MAREPVAEHHNHVDAVRALADALGEDGAPLALHDRENARHDWPAVFAASPASVRFRSATPAIVSAMACISSARDDRVPMPPLDGTLQVVGKGQHRPSPLHNARGRVVAALNTGVAAVQSSPEDLVTLFHPALIKVQDALRRILK